MAWLAQTPDKAKKPRHETMKGNSLLDYEPDLSYAWLIGLAQECGLYSSNGMGASAISWSDIKAWAACTHEDSIWLLKFIRLLSENYVAEYYAAKDPQRQTPLNDLMEEEQVRSSVFDSFIAIAKNKGKK